MSQRDINYIDNKYSSGDSKDMKQYQEENNNEVDELSKDLSNMGCVVGVVKRSPNVCVETCVYESDEEKSEHDYEENYSDEFESEDEEPESVKTESKLEICDEDDDRTSKFIQPKLSHSRSSMSSNEKASSVSGRSSLFGSVSVPETRRVNMSFTNSRLREIERHNNILLTKILEARNTRKSSIPPKSQPPPRRPVPSAAVTRKKQQKQIDHDNMILLKKIQRAKSSAYTVRR